MGRIYRYKELITYLKSSFRNPAYSGFVGYQNLGDEIIWEEIKKQFLPNRVVSVPPLEKRFRQNLINLKRHKLTILGGGTLIGDNFPDGSNPFREHLKACMDRSEHAIAFGTGVGLLYNDPRRDAWVNYWKPLLEKFDYIGVRGPDSAATLKSIGLDPEILGDPACLATREHGFWSPDQKKTVGINIGPVPIEEQKPGFSWGPFVSCIATFARLLASKGWDIAFYPVCTADPEVVQRVILESGLTSASIRPFFVDGNGFIESVGKLRAFIGVKLHSVVLANCAGVPSLMLEYAPKCRDFMRSIGKEELTIDINDVNIEILNNQLDILLSKGNSISRENTERMLDYRRMQIQRASELRSRFC